MSEPATHDDSAGYRYLDAELHESHSYLLPTVLEILAQSVRSGAERRIFDLGCGSGAVANALAKHGYQVTGIDASSEGILQANRHFPGLRLEQGSVYDVLSSKYGKFPVVLSLEVVEHLYSPRKFARAAFDLLSEGGIAIVSTPYHGYLKNLALALAGKMDRHFTALWDHGHIKFWSRNTLSQLMTEAGFRIVAIHRVGRIPPLAKSMVIVARKVAQEERHR